MLILELSSFAHKLLREDNSKNGTFHCIFEKQNKNTARNWYIRPLKKKRGVWKRIQLYARPSFIWNGENSLLWDKWGWMSCAIICHWTAQTLLSYLLPYSAMELLADWRSADARKPLVYAILELCSTHIFDNFSAFPKPLTWSVYWTLFPAPTFVWLNRISDFHFNLQSYLSYVTWDYKM